MSMVRRCVLLMVKRFARRGNFNRSFPYSYPYTYLNRCAALGEPVGGSARCI